MILYSIIAAGVMAVAGFFYGQHVQAAVDKAAQVDAIANAIADYDEVAQADKQTAVDQAVKRTKAQKTAAGIKGKSDDEIRKQPLADNCNWNVPTFGLLTNAVNAANAEETAQPGVSDAVRKSNRTGK